MKETGERIPAGDRETEDGGTFAEYVRDQYNVNPNEKLGDELTALHWIDNTFAEKETLCIVFWI